MWGRAECIARFSSTDLAYWLVSVLDSNERWMAIMHSACCGVSKIFIQRNIMNVCFRFLRSRFSKNSDFQCFSEALKSVHPDTDGRNTSAVLLNWEKTSNCVFGKMALSVLGTGNVCKQVSTRWGRTKHECIPRYVHVWRVDWTHQQPQAMKNYFDLVGVDQGTSG